MDGSDMHVDSPSQEAQSPPSHWGFPSYPSPHPLVCRSPGTRFGLDGDLYIWWVLRLFCTFVLSKLGSYFPCWRYHTIDPGSNFVYITQPYNPYPSFSFAKPNFEVGESSNTRHNPTTINQPRPTHFQTLGLLEWAQQRPQVNTSLTPTSPTALASISPPTQLLNWDWLKSHS